jgi:hypothetical protein
LPRTPVEDDLEATRIINPADNRQPAGADSPQPADDDLEATLIQSPPKTSGPNGQPSPVHKGPPSPPVSPQVQDRSRPDQASTDGNNDDEDIMEQTIIIRSDVKKE